ncbi:MAG: ABC transporter permease [Actinomycetota bacterium]|nr:ABC transporter permease [Actinomycetota bacterium]
MIPSPSNRSVVLGVAWRTLHRLYTTPALILPSLIFPLFFFTAFAGGLSAVSKIPDFHYRPGYTAFQFAFVLLQASAFGGVFTGFGIAADFENGFADRLLLAAPHRIAVLAGYAFAALSRTVVTAAILFGVALAAGMNVYGNGVDLFGLIGLALLVNAAATLWAAGIAMRFRSIQAGPMMQIPVFLALFLAPVYLPLPLLTGWIHAVASVNPITAIVDTARDFLAGTAGDVALGFGAAAGLAGLFALWALRGLRRAEAAA